MVLSCSRHLQLRLPTNSGQGDVGIGVGSGLLLSPPDSPSTCFSTGRSPEIHCHFGTHAERSRQCRHRGLGSAYEEASVSFCIGTPALRKRSMRRSIYFAMLGLMFTIAAWIKLRPLYAVWMSGCWLLFNSVNFLQSVPRYSLTMFPIFILFALLAKNRFWNAVLTCWSLLFLALFTSLFVRGWW